MGLKWVKKREWKGKDAAKHNPLGCVLGNLDRTKVFENSVSGFQHVTQEVCALLLDVVTSLVWMRASLFLVSVVHSSLL